jgi:hypothetical protein
MTLGQMHDGFYISKYMDNGNKTGNMEEEFGWTEKGNLLRL